MPTLTKSMENILKSTSPNLKISFPSTSSTISGQQLSKQDSRPAPTLFLKSPTPSKTYISMSLDPDAPFPAFPFLAPILHGIQTGLTAEGAPDSDGWVKLTGSGNPVVPWTPPAPPGISAPHRYVFLVWEQPDGLTDQSIKKEMGWGDQVGLASRMRWDQDGFESKFRLDRFVGGDWFICG